MKEMRLALRSDEARLKEIWKLCFGDPDSFIDFYFAKRFKESQMAVCLVDNVLAAMLTMIPVQPVEQFEGTKRIKGSMLYAIATHPAYQHQGIARELMDWAAGYLREHGVELCVLVPAEASLFGFYKRQGYREGFSIREVVLSREEINALWGNDRFGDSAEISIKRNESACKVLPMDPQAYNSIRAQLLQGTAYVDYRDEEIAYQKNVSQLSGADIFALSISGVQGCAAVERLHEDKVLVKELLLPEECYPAGLKALAHTVQAQEFIIRTPGDKGKVLGGQIRPFGMLKLTNSCIYSTNKAIDGEYAQNFNMAPLEPEQVHKVVDEMAYLGLAFD